MKIKFDGIEIEGIPQEIVEEMNERTWYRQSDTAEYMRRFAQRMWNWSNTGIRLEHPKKFLLDLAREDVLEIIEEGGDK